MYAAGAVTVPWTIDLFDEIVRVDTAWGDHSHPHHELLWNERGVSTATVGGRTWSVTSRFGLWMPAGVVHSATAQAGTWYRSIHFGVHAMPSIADAPMTVEITPLLRLLLQRLDDRDLSDSSRQITEALVLDVLAPAAQEILVRLPSSALLRPMVDAVRTSPAAAHSLEGWAAVLGVSPRTITRALHKETGLGFTRWVISVRVQHAVDLLSRGWAIEDVAREVGYASPSAFGAAFLKVTGSTPGKIRAVRFSTEGVV